MDFSAKSFILPSRKLQVDYSLPDDGFACIYPLSREGFITVLMPSKPNSVLHINLDGALRSKITTDLISPSHCFIPEGFITMRAQDNKVYPCQGLAGPEFVRVEAVGDPKLFFEIKIKPS